MTPPTPTQIRAAAKKANLTGSQAAALVGVTSRTWRRWTSGERPIPYAAWRLLLIETGQDTTKSSHAATIPGT